MRLSDLFESTTGNMEILKDISKLLIDKMPQKIFHDEIKRIWGDDLNLKPLREKYQEKKQIAFLNKIEKTRFVFSNHKRDISTILGWYNVSQNELFICISAFMRSNETVELKDILAKENYLSPLKTFRGILLHELRHLFQAVDYSDYFHSSADRAKMGASSGDYTSNPIELDAAWFHHLQDYDVEEYKHAPNSYVKDVMKSFSGYKKLNKKQLDHYRKKTGAYYVAVMKGESVDHLNLPPQERLKVKRKKVEQNILDILNRFEWDQDLNLREEIAGYDMEAGSFLLPMRRLASVRQVAGAEKVSLSHKVFLFILLAIGFSESTDNAASINNLMKMVHKFTYQDAINNLDEVLKSYSFDNESLKKLIREVFSKDLKESEVELWNDKHVVAFRRGYRIVVDDPNDASYVTVWTNDNKKVGSLSTRGKMPHKELNEYLNIAVADVDVKHRKQGLGLAMYKALINHMHPRWKGIGSYLPDRSNKKQIPKIYQKLGGKIIDDDYMIVDRANLMENDREHQDTLNATGCACSEHLFLFCCMVSVLNVSLSKIVSGCSPKCQDLQNL
jgi:ribosomal protein S18 acetylase RimI-like enzyme